MIEIGALTWLAACSWFDWKKRLVPNWLTIPAVVLALALRLLGFAQGDGVMALGVVVLVVGGWLAHILGGADLKVTAALALLDPRLAVWAWLGMIGWYLAVRLVTIGYKEKGPYRLPGMVGFAAGVSFLLMWIYVW